MSPVRDGPLEKLWGVGQSTEKRHARENWVKKNSFTVSSPEKMFLCTEEIFLQGKCSRKKFMQLDNPPPITFLMVCPLAMSR